MNSIWRFTRRFLGNVGDALHRSEVGRVWY